MGTRRAYTNPCLGGGRKAAGAMLEYARCAILQVVNQVQQYERVPFLAADLEIPSTGPRFFDGNQTRTSCAGYPYGQGRTLFSRQRRRPVGEEGHIMMFPADASVLSLITADHRDAGVLDTSRHVCRQLTPERLYITWIVT